MENLFIILRLVRQYKLGRKGRSSRPGPGPAVTDTIMTGAFIMIKCFDMLAEPMPSRQGSCYVGRTHSFEEWVLLCPSLCRKGSAAAGSRRCRSSAVRSVAARAGPPPLRSYYGGVAARPGPPPRVRASDHGSVCQPEARPARRSVTSLEPGAQAPTRQERVHPKQKVCLVSNPQYEVPRIVDREMSSGLYT